MSVKTKRSYEGYLMIDNRAGGPVSDEDIHKAGLPKGAGRGLFEAATYTCRHCGFIVVIEQTRTRDRAYCRGCDHFICDGCGVLRAAGAPCRTFDQIADEVMEAAEKGANTPRIILST